MPKSVERIKYEMELEQNALYVMLTNTSIGRHTEVRVFQDNDGLWKVGAKSRHMMNTETFIQLNYTKVELAKCLMKFACDSSQTPFLAE